MIDDRDLRELFARKATKMEIDRTMPNALAERARRRQALFVLTGAVAALAVAAIAWAGLRSTTRSDPIPPARHDSNKVETILPGLHPTAKRLAGIWLWDDGGPVEPVDVMVRLSPDGTFAMDDLGQIDTVPAILGTYEISGDRVSFAPGPDGGACVTGNDWTWRIRVEPRGRMHTVMVEDGEGNCSIGVGTQWSFTRVSPASPAAAGIPVARTRSDHAPVDPGDLSGIWLDTQSGRLLRFAWDSTYAIDDAGRLGLAPDDIGDFTMDAGNITFTSDRQSRACRNGAARTWSNVRITGRTLRAVIPANECSGEAASEVTWLLIGAVR